jgi:hypothetical protein
MSVSFNSNGTISGTIITASTQFTGSGIGITNIPGSGITLSSSNSVVITNGSSNLTTETTLSPIRGGTGTNSSAATGIPHVSGGTWTYSGIVNADLAGGFTVSNAQTTATSNNTPNTIVFRDGSGNFSAGNVTTSVLTQTTTNGISTEQTANVQTTNASATPILTLATTNSSVFSALVMISCIDTTDSSNNTGTISYFIKASTGSGGAVLISTLASYVSILDSNVSTAASTVSTTGNNNVTFNVSGIVAKNINWIIKVFTLSQA